MTKRRARKRARERHNRLARLVRTPDHELSPEQRIVKGFHLALEHFVFYGTKETP